MNKMKISQLINNLQSYRNIDLTDKECMEILESLKEKYDSSKGITWQDVCLEHDYFLEEKRK